ncbi:anti-sigma F factor antagonist [Thermohalobacter berrensis]|uniref:Anti-sigma F factor antagonist n=1 Tax=Thermohalobacter berrensis TaxID=99594 RepID=A0A419TB46_9FIRM|nr:anti-sigma F factor antagonist [Thermohalobacter berrensis]RKD34708.1 anti-sigma F factor antagonist [Thermohalobacter berrensis]
MQLEFKTIDKTLIVKFNGELDHHTAENIRKEIDKFYSGNMLKNIILDLEKLNFMDSSGIGLILGRYKNVSQNGGKLCLVNVSPRVEKILKMSGVLKIVKIFDSITKAKENI